MREEIDIVLNLFDTDYVDSILLLPTAFSRFGEKEVFGFITRILDEKLTRFVSLSNFSLDFLKNFKKEFGEKFFSHETQLNFEIRINQDVGIIDFLRDNDVLPVIYQPIRRNRTAQRNWPLLIELAEKYDKTQNQILFNWLISIDTLPITKSENIEHIDETVGALDFELEADDIKKINEFRPPGWERPVVDWERSGEGVRVDQLSNIFDERYDE
jgi:diketogulonate reductase-like aldo/keto reductase